MLRFLFCRFRLLFSILTFSVLLPSLSAHPRTSAPLSSLTTLNLHDRFAKLFDYCIHSSDWSQSSCVEENCVAKLTCLFREDCEGHGPEVFDFLAPGVTAHITPHIIRMPLRYVVGECTLSMYLISSLT